MSILGSNMLAGAAGRARYEIERSLRFNDDDDAYLQRQPGSAGNRRTFTFSAWIKRASGLGNDQQFFTAAPSGHANDSAISYLAFNTNDQLDFFNYWSSNFRGRLQTNAKFRDVSAWYHIVLRVDTTDSTANDRFKLFVNGTEETSFNERTNPDQNLELYINDSVEHKLGEEAVRNRYNFDGYMAEINLVDGTALDASYFGETDLETGAWIPKKYRGSFGTNGFYLDFADNSGVTATTLGKDNSGNGNNWTPNNLSVTAGTGNDSFQDTPTNNWCTLNPLNKGVDSITFDQGNLRYSTSGTDHLCVATFAIPTSGKWYWEYRKDSNGTNTMAGIICRPEAAGSGLSTFLGGQADGFSVYAQNGQAYNNGNGSTYMATPGTNSTITVAFDADNSKMYVGADGNWGNGSGSTNQTFANAAVAHTLPTDKTCYPAISVSSGNAFVNFGQRPFDHTPPAGFRALNAKNLPAPTIKDGTKYFNTVLFTGNGSTQSITGVGFQPDWTWIKMRSDGTRGFGIFDAVRGGLMRLDSTGVMEGRTNEGNISFQTDGFNITSSHPSINDSSDSAVAWNWKAGGAASNNQDGSTHSDVSANPEAGFSIVKYRGNSTAGATIGHGLGAAPKVIFTKSFSNNIGNWGVYHYGIDATSPEDYMLNLNLSNDLTNSALWWNDTAPTSTVFTVGTSNDVNGSADYIAYCFAEVKGYSKFGSWIGNGITDGPYVHCGFKPAFVLWKNSSASAGYNWYIADNVRSSSNPIAATLAPNIDSSEDTAWGSGIMDFTSNGFKIRRSQDETNRSGDTHIFMAFAEMPFKYANAR